MVSRAKGLIFNILKSEIKIFELYLMGAAVKRFIYDKKNVELLGLQSMSYYK